MQQWLKTALLMSVLLFAKWLSSTVCVAAILISHDDGMPEGSLWLTVHTWMLGCIVLGLDTATVFMT